MGWDMMVVRVMMMVMMGGKEVGERERLREVESMVMIRKCSCGRWVDGKGLGYDLYAYEYRTNIIDLKYIGEALITAWQC